MKKIILLLLLFSSLAISQNKKSDVLLKEFSIAKNDVSRYKLCLEIVLFSGNLSQQEKINYCKKILEITKSQKNKVIESVATAQLAYILAINGNNLQATEICFNALELAQQADSDLALGFVYDIIAICASNDNTKYLNYLHKGLNHATKAKDTIMMSCISSNLSNAFPNLKYKDSALYYAQRAYTLSSKIKNRYVENFALNQLSNIHYYMFEDKKIGYEYVRKTLRSKYTNENPDAYLNANLNIAVLFLSDRKLDSALYYANRANTRKDLAPYRSTLFLFQIYKAIYNNTNKDSALLYYQKYEIAKDSIDTLSNSQQQQILSINKELELSKAEEERKDNLQFIFIAIGIFTLLILFLLLSRSFITNTKLIRFFGVIGLLIVFEFLNLLLHPFLEKVTHHSPVLMLLALVGIAALLVPLHHKVEHWATAKLVEKNKQIRLANAKKTIAQLEDID